MNDGLTESFIPSVASIFMESLAGAQHCSESLCNNEQNKFPGLGEASLRGEGGMGGSARGGARERELILGCKVST